MTAAAGVAAAVSAVLLLVGIIAIVHDSNLPLKSSQTVLVSKKQELLEPKIEANGWVVPSVANVEAATTSSLPYSIPKTSPCRWLSLKTRVKAHLGVLSQDNDAVIPQRSWILQSVSG
jgi:hypothetical protein